MQPAREGFSAVQRLHNSAEFGRVFAAATRSQDRFFTVLACPNTHNVARLGLTMSRRAARRAVDRNRLKRLAREAFRMQQLPALDFVVIAKPDAARAAAADVRRSLDEHFVRLGRKLAGRA